MAVAGVSSSSGASVPVVSKEQTGFSGLNADSFMKMLIAQLQNQDPLNPLDSANFSAQLAQFSSLQQLTEINGHLAQLKSQGRLAWDICMAVALHQVIMHVQGINTVRFEAVVELVQRRGVCQLDRA